LDAPAPALDAPAPALDAPASDLAFDLPLPKLISASFWPTAGGNMIG
jgi:hypothetical protein